MKSFDKYEDAILTDFLFDTNLSKREIGEELGCTETEISQRIRELGLGWVRRNKGHLSRGQSALTALMRKLLPGEKIVAEHPIDGRLKLDVYCPSYNLAAEYHGRQHFEYVEYFHSDMRGFLDSIKRDERKVELCREHGIALIVFRYNDKMTEEVVYDRMLDAIRTAPQAAPLLKKRSAKDNPSYELWKQRQREYRQQSYRKMKKVYGTGR